MTEYKIHWTTYSGTKIQISASERSRPNNIKPLRPWEVFECTAVNDAQAMAMLVKHVKNLTGVAVPFNKIKGRTNICYCRVALPIIEIWHAAKPNAKYFPNDYVCIAHVNTADPALAIQLVNGVIDDRVVPISHGHREMRSGDLLVFSETPPDVPFLEPLEKWTNIAVYRSEKSGK